MLDATGERKEQLERATDETRIIRLDGLKARLTAKPSSVSIRGYSSWIIKYTVMLSLSRFLESAVSNKTGPGAQEYWGTSSHASI
jgi:hypothetical protein